jgi:hypothetical protein
MPLIQANASPKLPTSPGVYAVAYDLDRPKVWPSMSCGGWHKGHDPTVTAQRLDQEWVDGTNIVYLGKTDRTLRKRLSEFSRFGKGEAVAHWGGRLIWQLPQVEKLLVGWRQVEIGMATSEESNLLNEFSDTFGHLPFANLRR